MPQLHIEGHGIVSVEQNQRLLLAIQEAGVDILHRCGGQARCTTCMVDVQEGTASPMTRAEQTVLQAKGITDSGRLSCQMTCTHDLHVQVRKTTQSTGLDAGPAVKEYIEPEPEFLSYT